MIELARQRLDSTSTERLLGVDLPPERDRYIRVCAQHRRALLLILDTLDAMWCAIGLHRADTWLVVDRATDEIWGAGIHTRGYGCKCKVGLDKSKPEVGTLPRDVRPQKKPCRPEIAVWLPAGVDARRLLAAAIAHA